MKERPGDPLLEDTGPRASSIRRGVPRLWGFLIDKLYSPAEVITVSGKTPSRQPALFMKSLPVSKTLQRVEKLLRARFCPLLRGLKPQFCSAFVRVFRCFGIVLDSRPVRPRLFQQP